MESIRVLIVDDHPMVRIGLSSLLSSFSDIEVVGRDEDGTTALRSILEYAPNVILLDIELGRLNGILMASEILKQAPKVKIIILTAYDNDEYVEGALRAGAYGYVLKSSSPQTVVEAVRLVYHGQHMLSPKLLDRVLAQFQKLSVANARYESGLSEEEVQVLTLIAQGTTNDGIAKNMYWAQRTVTRKVDDIMSKMGVRSRAQAVAEAIKKGLI